MNALRFELNAEENMLKLESELKNKIYHPSRSILFFVKKPKLREIFAADFRDRVVHHILVGYLEPLFESLFIYDSYACRVNKGTHRAVIRAQSFIRKVSKNGKIRAYYLQLDIKSFFINIDKEILLGLIRKRTKNKDVFWLAEKIIFHDCTRSYTLRDNKKLFKEVPENKTLFGKENKKGLPIGNLTSQFFANVYLNELDQFVKHNLRCRYYLRYTDDFILLDSSREKLVPRIEEIGEFLKSRLGLRLHPKRMKLQPVLNGIDFLGYIIRRDYILIRRRVVNNMNTRLRYFERCGAKGLDYGALEELRSSIQSYLGHFKWANSYKLRENLFKRKIIKDYFGLADGRLVRKYGQGRIAPAGLTDER
ncbi:MAG: reverse transcriptase/maturase family protein [Candidatus Omnitrophota bacterium]|nr:reverse transcriptase/maturase family protein [Candidatus Omnitrophota bacterium]